MMSRARRRFTAIATRCCCAPSCRLRSTRRRSASPLATMRARDWRSSSACLRSSSSVVCSAVSSRALCTARPTCRASSVSTRSSSSENASAVAARSAMISPSSSPAWLTGATLTWTWARPSSTRGQPDRGPGVPGNPGPGHDSALPVRHHDRPRSGVGHRGDAFQHVSLTGVDLGAGQRHGLAQRLGELQQQLVHGDRPGQPRAEGAQGLVGRLLGPVDEAGGRRDQPVPGRQVPDRGDRRGQHREPEDLAVGGVARPAADAEHDHQVDGRDHGGEPRDRQHLDQDPAAVGPERRQLAGHHAEREQ